jgi:hypothetical protein
VGSAARTPLPSDQGVHRGQLSQEEINQLIKELADVRTVIQYANPADKARIYEELGLVLTYHPAKHVVRAEINLGQNIHGGDALAQKSTNEVTMRNQTSKSGGAMVGVRGGT